MTWAGLMSELRSNTNTDSSSYADANVLIDLNKSYHFIEDLITQTVWESFFYQEFSFNTVIGQKEYTLDATIRDNTDWTNKVLSVSIDYGNWLKKLRKVDVNSLTEDVSWYSENQSVSDPFYTIQDNSIMIFPSPVATWTGKYYAVQNLIDITSSTTEANIFNGRIHKKYHYIIAIGAEQYAYRRLKLEQEEANANARFMKALFWDGGQIPWMMNLLDNRQRGARVRQMPEWYSYNV